MNRPKHAGESDELPEYAEQLACFHREFETELRDMVATVPLRSDAVVLDAACGDGFYSELLAERLSAKGQLVGLDLSQAYLDVARKRPALQSARTSIEFWQGDVAGLDTVARQFDLVWCAQSLYSLPEPVAALRQLAAPLRPGGMLAVLENDSLHQVLLPWPSDFELALRAAEYRCLEDQTGKPGKYYIGRRLPRTFAHAGLEPCGFCTQTIDRRSPLSDDLRTFLQSYLDNLCQRVLAYLTPDRRAQLRALIDPASPDYLLNDSWFTMSWQNVLAWARKPEEEDIDIARSSQELGGIRSTSTAP